MFPKPFRRLARHSTFPQEMPSLRNSEWRLNKCIGPFATANRCRCIEHSATKSWNEGRGKYNRMRLAKGRCSAWLGRFVALDLKPSSVRTES